MRQLYLGEERKSRIIPSHPDEEEEWMDNARSLKIAPDAWGAPSPQRYSTPQENEES